jgi:hypothetical protein
MRTAMITLSLLLIAASPTPSAISARLLVGEWRSDEGTRYHFYANGTWSSHAADMGEGGRWRVGGEDQLELIVEDARDKPGQPAHREIIVIERVVHETLYVRHYGQKEIWLKQPGV